MKKFILGTVVVSVFAFAGLAQADLIPGFRYVISYDGYVEVHDRIVFTDTLIVVNNADPIAPMPLWLEVFDKKGEPVWEGELFDGGLPLPRVPPNGYGWITLGMILQMVGRDTHDPWGSPAAEKLHIRISAKHEGSTLRIVPTVEIKQVIYQQPISVPGRAIWQPAMFRCWTETALGGNKYATGVIYAP
jgi:hypothetical protein